jgi:hypothetical protein
VTVPWAELAVLIIFLVLSSALALGGALVAVNRVRPASVLREA